MNCQAYKLDIERHTFKGDELAIRPIADPAAINRFAPSQQKPPQPQPTSAATAAAAAPILSGTLHTGRLELRRGPTAESPLLATARYPTSSPKITFETGAERVNLTHSYVHVDAWGRTSENAKPKKSFWTGRVKDGSRGCYIAVFPDGTKLRWEPAGPREDVDAYKKAGKKHHGGDMTAPKLRCVIADPLGATVLVLGEMLASNDVIRLMPGAELLSRSGSMMGVYVLLGFVSLFERARTRDKRKAETEFEVDFMIDGGGGDGGGGDGGGGDGGGGGGGS